ncbi:S66 family peptidase [Chitinimonas sp. JJ19]|uniref:S66 family peptidase n=1 Tax=Chitinimonas sp. JJ19 TaxID=3109352 RepID=UPI003001994F
MSHPPIIRPRKLRRGDRIAVVASSWGGPATCPERYEQGKRQLAAAFGLDVVEMPHALKPANWLARNPQARADDLMQAFADPAIAGIISAIGGEDSIRLLRHLDFEAIRKHPKVYMGYSDSTVSHLACYKAGLGSFYGPSIMSGFAENGGLHDYLRLSVQRLLFEDGPAGEIRPNPDGWVVEQYDWSDVASLTRPRPLNAPLPWRYLRGQGVVRGHLLGGCLEVLDMLRGSRCWPSLAQWQGAILFLETSEDAPAPSMLRYFLRNLAEQGVLQGLQGILLGRPGGKLAPSRFVEYDEALLQVLDEEGLTELAVVTHMDFGHTDPMCVLPYGVMVEIDCDAQRISLVESATLP